MLAQPTLLLTDQSPQPPFNTFRLQLTVGKSLERKAPDREELLYIEYYLVLRVSTSVP